MIWGYHYFRKHPNLWKGVHLCVSPRSQETLSNPYISSGRPKNQWSDGISEVAAFVDGWTSANSLTSWGRLVVSPHYLQGLDSTIHPFGGFCSRDFSHPQWARRRTSWSLIGFDGIWFKQGTPRTPPKKTKDDNGKNKNFKMYLLLEMVIFLSYPGVSFCEFLVLPYTLFNSECYSYGRTDQRVCKVSTTVSFMGWFNLKAQVVDWSFKLTFSSGWSGRGKTRFFLGGGAITGYLWKISDLKTTRNPS